MYILKYKIDYRRESDYLYYY